MLGLTFDHRGGAFRIHRFATPEVAVAMRARHRLAGA